MTPEQFTLLYEEYLQSGLSRKAFAKRKRKPTQEYFERKEQLLNKLDNLEASSAKTKSRGISSVKSQLAMLESQNNSRLVEYLGEKYQTDQSFKDEVDKFNLFEMGERDKYVLEDRTGRAIRTSMNRLKSEIKSGIREMAFGALGGYVAGRMAGKFMGWLANGRVSGKAVGLVDDFTNFGDEVAKGVQLTKHGAERITGAATRGGVLSIEEIGAIRTLVQKPIIQGDGAKVFIHEVSPGKFSGFIENQNTGKIITTMNNWSKKSIIKMGKNHGWSVE